MMRGRPSVWLWGSVALLAGCPRTAEAEPHLASVTLQRRVIELFERCELTIRIDGPIANPYDPGEISVDASFLPPRGSTVTVPGFFYQPYARVEDQGRTVVTPDGEPVWKVRFTPTRTGVWSYDVTVKTRLGSRASSRGTVEVIESMRRGFVRLDRARGTMRFDDGEPFIPIGENLGWPASSAQPLASYEQWIRDLAKQRANYLRVWMAPWAFRLETNETGVGRYDQLRAWYVDQLLDRSEQAGLYWQLCLLDHGSFSTVQDPEWPNNPYNEALGGMCRLPNDFLTDPRAHVMFKRLLRYLVARWGAHPQLAVWELFNEVDLSQLQMKDVPAWTSQMSAFLRSIDVTQRPVTISFQKSPAEAVWSLPTIDLVQLHVYNERDFAELFSNRMIHTLRQKFRKPVMVAEFGWITEFVRQLDVVGLHLHDGIWASLMGGAAGSGLPWYWDTYIHPNHLERHFGPLAQFWRGERLDARLQPLPVSFSDADLLGCGIGRPDRAFLWMKNRTNTVDHYLAYRCAVAAQRLRAAQGQTGPPLTYPSRTIDGATATVTGLDRLGRYRVEWWDPYQGTVMARSVQRTRWGTLTLPVPQVTFDVAAKLIRLQWWERN